MDKMKEYRDLLVADMNQVIEQQRENIEKAAQIMTDTVKSGNKIYFFGTGHSYITGQEVFARAGGYGEFVPILENELGMNHAFKSTLIERTAAYADVIMGLYVFKPGDAIVMTSNSGRNALLVEMALRLKKLGMKIICITALDSSKASTSRHPSGLRLFELADVVLDNRSVMGDASISHNEEIKTGPTSTIMDCYLIQLVVTQFVQNELDRGVDAPVFRSSNIDGGDEYNRKLFENYR